MGSSGAVAKVQEEGAQLKQLTTQESWNVNLNNSIWNWIKLEKMAEQEQLRNLADVPQFKYMKQEKKDIRAEK